jgi:hypothetical protein
VDPKKERMSQEGMSTELRPIFIVGVHRSGTTLLRFMLNSSPRIYIPPESDFIPRFFLARPHERLSRKRIATFLSTIFTEYRFGSEWQGDPPQIDAFVQSMPSANPSGFLAALYGSYAQQHDAQRWGDKTPIYASYLDLLDQLFPDAQFIHAIRDGRDVAISMLEKWGKAEIHVDIFFTARNWVRRIRRARTSGARLGPKRYYELRYERLVADPVTEVRALCDFLGEPYIPEMAQPQILGREAIDPKSWEAPIRQAPNTARIGRWQQEMSLADQRLFQRIAGTLLTALDYELLDLGPMPLSEVVRMVLLGAKYTTLQVGRRVLQALGLFPPI